MSSPFFRFFYRLLSVGLILLIQNSYYKVDWFGALCCNGLYTFSTAEHNEANQTAIHSRNIHRKVQERLKEPTLERPMATEYIIVALERHKVRKARNPRKAAKISSSNKETQTNDSKYRQPEMPHNSISLPPDFSHDPPPSSVEELAKAAQWLSSADNERRSVDEFLSYNLAIQLVQQTYSPIYQKYFVSKIVGRRLSTHFENQQFTDEGNQVERNGVEAPSGASATGSDTYNELSVDSQNMAFDPTPSVPHVNDRRAPKRLHEYPLTISENERHHHKTDEGGQGAMSGNNKQNQIRTKFGTEVASKGMKKEMLHGHPEATLHKNSSQYHESDGKVSKETNKSSQMEQHKGYEWQSWMSWNISPKFLIFGKSGSPIDKENSDTGRMTINGLSESSPLRPQNIIAALTKSSNATKGGSEQNRDQQREESISSINLEYKERLALRKSTGRESSSFTEQHSVVNVGDGEPTPSESHGNISTAGDFKKLFLGQMGKKDNFYDTSQREELLDLKTSTRQLTEKSEDGVMSSNQNSTYSAAKTMTLDLENISDVQYVSSCSCCCC